MKRCVFSFILLFSLLVLLDSNKLIAAPNRYSVITLENWTPYAVSYIYRWGKGSQFQSNTIEPFGTYTHWWKFKHDNENWAPWFYIKIEGDPSGWYKLGSYFSPDTNVKNGRWYIIDMYDDNGYLEFYLDEY